MRSAAPTVSADDHFVEPPELWHELLPERLPPRFRDRAPRLDGVGLVVEGNVAPAFDLFPDLVARSDRAPGASDVDERLEIMDAEGIDIAIVYQQRAMAMLAISDVELRLACFDAYNEWIAGVCSHSGGRLRPVGILATLDAPEATADRLARFAELGIVAAQLPSAIRGPSYSDPALEPIWAAIEESGIPLTFHVGESPDGNGPGDLGTYLTSTFQPFRPLWARLVFTGILERHPELRVVFAEGNISWVPSAIDHADRIHRDFAFDLSPRLANPPSHHWHTQCYATFMDDPTGVEQIDRIGRDRALWSTDYPHPEGTFGRTAEIRATLPEPVVGANAARVYDLTS